MALDHHSTPPKYVAKKTDANGYVSYDNVENQTWATLFARQMPIVQSAACKEYIAGVKLLDFTADKIPQLPDVNKKLLAATGWQVAPVAALISFDRFFKLLSERKFPAATFIRIPEELDYLEEPDIFHELFGHCPMLTNQACADFTAYVGKLGLNANPRVQKLLARLYWFTIEFGLIQTENEQLKIYGGGILSSIGETHYSLNSPLPQRKPFDLMTALRTPYRIDIYQTVYFVINSFEQLYNLTKIDLIDAINQAIALGDFEPTYPPKNKEH